MKTDDVLPASLADKTFHLAMGAMPRRIAPSALIAVTGEQPQVRRLWRLHPTDFAMKAIRKRSMKLKESRYRQIWSLAVTGGMVF